MVAWGFCVFHAGFYVGRGFIVELGFYVGRGFRIYLGTGFYGG